MHLQIMVIKEHKSYERIFFDIQSTIQTTILLVRQTNSHTVPINYTTKKQVKPY